MKDDTHYCKKLYICKSFNSNYSKMKKTIVLLASIAATILVMLSSCKSEPTTTNNTTETKNNSKTLTDGQWSVDFLGDRNTYLFNDDNTGKFISSSGEDDCYDFTYEIAGDSIFISQISEDAIFDIGPDKYAYRIKGNELNLKGGYLGLSDMTYKWEKRK